MRRYIYLLLSLCTLQAVLTPLNSQPSTHFFRGAWIATVANIDWPTEESVGNTEMQQQQLITMLDQLADLGMNAVIFQARPTADALYLSDLEPISHWLTGQQGSWGKQTPWDPLAFAVQEAHKRHMELHVWLNPYRLNIATMDTTVLCADHIFHRHPEWFWQYGKQWYFDPANPETRDYLCAVVADIVTRYDIDAVHMDDYFYPYPIGKQPLPDAAAFRANPRGFTDIRDWRRDNVNLTIQELSSTIHAIKPHVEFGISPFGVWRNQPTDPTSNSASGLAEGSATRAGITNYDDLYADILLWMREGWIDYVLPQLYWEIGKKVADYEILAHWWADRTREILSQHSIKLYIGMAPYRLAGAKENAAWTTGNEIVRQMRLNRTIPEITGECFYSTRPLLKNPLHVCDSIRTIYQHD